MYKRVKNFKNEKLFYPLDLVVAVIVIAVLVAVLVTVFRPTGSKVEIYVDGVLKYSYDLDEDRVINIDDEGRNVVIIENGAVRMAEADCHNQLCVKNKAITKAGEQIVCLPNKVAVIITDGKGGELDATT